jgi:hypothetical protein
MRDPYELERCLISAALRIAQKQELSQSDFGRAVFPEHASGYATMLALQKPRSPKKVLRPRALKLREALAMAQALRMDLSDLLAIAEKEMRTESGADVSIPEMNGTRGG